MTRVLSVGSDRSIFSSGSASRARQEAYAKKLGNLDIIVFSRKSDQLQPLRAGSLNTYSTNVNIPLFHILQAIRIARALPSPDVITAQDPFEAGFVAWVLARMTGAPLHIQVHTDFLSPEFAKLSFLNKVRVFVAGFMLRRASRVRVVSERIKRSLDKKYALKTPVATLPIFVDIGRLRSAPRDEALENRIKNFKTKLLVVSRLEKEKRVELAVRAFAEAAPQDAGLIVIGEGRERASLENLVQALGISRRVLFEGMREPAPYYKASDLVLLPSRYDGYGMVIVEALAAGKPVLSTDVGVAREAGAIVAVPERFPDVLREWFEKGPRAGELVGYPYKNFEAYVQAHCDDIVACISGAKTQ